MGWPSWAFGFLDALSLVSILYSKFQNSHDEEDIENLRKADIASTPHLASPILY
jgi:hypothetical protein